MSEKKKIWSKPKLIILVRGKSQEGVLAACKASSPFAGPRTRISDCQQGIDRRRPPRACGARSCYGRVSS